MVVCIILVLIGLVTMLGIMISTSDGKTNFIIDIAIITMWGITAVIWLYYIYAIYTM